MSAENQDWCVLDGPYLKCLRCGGTEVVRLPQYLDAFLLRIKAFGIDHKYCKPAEEPPQ